MDVDGAVVGGGVDGEFVLVKTERDRAKEVAF